MDGGFLSLVSTGDRFRWQLPVTERVVGGTGFLFGGCHLAAAIVGMETATERNAVWATTQFVSSAALGDLVDLNGEVMSEGRSLTQGRVVSVLESKPIGTTLVALGGGTLEDQIEPKSAREANEPGAGLVVALDATSSGLRERMEIRSADLGPPADGSAGGPGRGRRLWIRFPGMTVGDSTSLAIVADFLAPTFSGALGRAMYGASVENSIRFFGRKDVEWLLVETWIDGLIAGVGHGTTHVWAETGELLALATQTCSVRELGS